MRFFLFIFFLIVFSCSSKDAVPDDVLPPVKMEKLLWDVMRIDEMNMYYAQTDTAFLRFDKNASVYGEVFRIHKTTKDEFRRSLKFYESRPDLFKPILDSLQKRSDAPPATVPIS